MSIRFGNLGLEGVPDIEGHPDEEGETLLVVDAPAGRGMFHGATLVKPLESYRTLKTYTLSTEGPPDSKSKTCDGHTWTYCVRYRSRVEGKWRAMSALVSMHTCSRGSVLVVETDDGEVLEWELPQNKPMPNLRPIMQFKLNPNPKPENLN